MNKQVHFFLTRFNRHEYSQIIIKECKHSIPVIVAVCKWTGTCPWNPLCVVHVWVWPGEQGLKFIQSIRESCIKWQEVLLRENTSVSPSKRLSPCSESMKPEFWSHIVYNHEQVRNHKKHILKCCPFLWMVTAICCLPYSPDICMVFYSELLI